VIRVARGFLGTRRRRHPRRQRLVARFDAPRYAALARALVLCFIT